MGTEELTASTKTGVRCGGCNHVSTTDDKFCGGCGESLFEACQGCGKAVLLTQKFCGSCGANLEQSLQQRIDKIHGSLAEAVKLAKSHQYEHSILLLRRAASPTDYRFKELASQAAAAIAKVEGLRDRATASAAALASQAKCAFDQNQQADAARLVQQIPEPLRDENCKQILAKSVTYLNQTSALVSELQHSIKEKNWTLAGSLLQQVIELAPGDPQFKKLAVQVADKLYQRAEACFQKSKYARAGECLISVPASCRREDHEEKQGTIDGMVWLSEQIDAEPFATANLGRLAVRMTKDAPHDEDAKAVVKKLAAQFKQRADSPRNPWAAWKAGSQSWFGGPAGMLAYPQSVGFDQDSALRKVPGRFNVAIGLAMQGLGLGRIKEQFVEAKGLFAGFGRRKKRSAWGIDIGTSSIRAVLLEQNDEGDLIVLQSYYQALEAPTCRAGHEQEAKELVTDAIEQMVAELEFDEAPVWVNFPAAELVTRFVCLPPLADKQAANLLKVEAEQRIPLPIEDLQLVQWIAALGDDQSVGRPASVSAARKSAVQQRLERCTQAGLQVAGMQADSLALVNFADLEFGDLWHQQADDESQAQSQPEIEVDPTQSVVLLDAGASTTTLLIVSGEAFWFWTVEAGGEVMTTVLANSTKLVARDAEEKKINPASLDHPARQFAVVERRQDELRGRLEKMISEANKHHSRFNINQAWCCGGACLTHGWIRRIMLAK
jgi:Tfp pilus assembly PilM family ATPase